MTSTSCGGRQKALCAREGPWEGVRAKKMAPTRVILSNLQPAEFEPLLPASNVKDDFEYPARPTTAGLADGPLEVFSTYRGHAMYLENGAYVYRSDPKGLCVNGLASFQAAGPEECFVRFKGEGWRATLEFVPQMWCAYCTQEIKDEAAHDRCKVEIWCAMAREFTRGKQALMQNQRPDVHKGETVPIDVACTEGAARRGAL